MKKIVDLCKDMFRGIISEIKKITIAQAFFIVLFTSILLVVAAYSNPRIFSFETIDFENPETFFDFFVRNGWFKIPYYLLVTLTVAFLGQIVLGKVLKKPESINIKTNTIFLIIGLLVAFGGYQAAPYFYPDLSKYDFDSFEAKSELNETLTNAEFCGNQVDFFFSPYEGYSIKAFDIVKSIEDDVPASINYNCVPYQLNEERACVKNHGVEYDPSNKDLLQSWIKDRARPAMVVGCKYVYKGLYSAQAYKEAICSNLEGGCPDGEAE